jgi:putative aldouronate transport system permease protein
MKAQAIQIPALRPHHERLSHKVWKKRYAYIFLLPGLVFFAVFSYVPMAGLILSFEKYNARLGMFLSPFIGWDNFERIFITPLAMKSIINTLTISLGRILFEFPAPILLALLLNEMRGRRLKRLYQTAFTFPHFLSWVIVAIILQDFLGSNGAVNYLLGCLHANQVNFLSTPGFFRPLLYITSVWKTMGWSAIIYIASIAGVGTELYEAAAIDGAGRLRRIWHITLPGIKTTIIIMLILKIGKSMNAGFDQIFNMRNSVVKGVTDIIDTYVYDITFQSTPNYGFSTAVGMFKSVINALLLLLANFGSKKLFGMGLFGTEKEQ